MTPTYHPTLHQKPFKRRFDKINQEMNSQSSKVSQKWLYIQNTINRENFKNNTISKFNIELILIYEESAVLEIDFQIITNNVSLRHKHTHVYTTFTSI